MRVCVCSVCSVCVIYIYFFTERIIYVSGLRFPVVGVQDEVGKQKEEEKQK